MNKFIFLMISFLSLGVHAQIDERDQAGCVPIKWDQNRTFTVNGTLHNYTHIILPEKILPGFTPVTGNSALWDVEGAGAHIYFKPNSTEKEGYSTTISVVGESGASYDFQAVRREGQTERCIKLIAGTVFSGSTAAALSNFVHPDIRVANEEAESWKRRYQQQEASHKEAMSNAVLEALRRYRYHIYTRYNWSTKKGSFIGSNLVSDVYDDGRFTYIRLVNDNKGLLTVEAELEGKTEVVESRYDDVSRMYRIVGIYPKFTMKYGEAKLLINRENNITQGSF